MGLKLPPEVEARVLELAGLNTPPTVRPAAPPPVTTAKVKLVITIDGLTLKSEANAGGRLKDKLARKKVVKDAVSDALSTLTPPALPRPVRVKLVRVGGRRMDDDNLARSFKAVQDTVADWLGVDDGDRKAVRWSYRQRAGYEPAVMLLIG